MEPGDQVMLLEIARDISGELALFADDPRVAEAGGLHRSIPAGRLLGAVKWTARISQQQQPRPPPVGRAKTCNVPSTRSVIRHCALSLTWTPRNPHCTAPISRPGGPSGRLPSVRASREVEFVYPDWPSDPPPQRGLLLPQRRGIDLIDRILPAHRGKPCAPLWQLASKANLPCSDGARLAALRSPRC